MNNIKKIISVALVAFLCITSTITTFAKNDNSVKIETGIDEDIYEMIEAYENNTFVEKNESNKMQTRELFKTFGMEEQSEESVKYIYDNKRVDENTYQATRIAMYSLEQESQGSKNGVIIFCRIVYDEKDFGDPWSYVMLKKVKGGVVQNNGNYWCEFLQLKYQVAGDAYDANGKRYGWKGSSCDYSTQVISPAVGTTYYIDGPCDYYYNMGAYGSYISGFVKGTISFRVGSSTNLEISSALEAI